MQRATKRGPTETTEELRQTLAQSVEESIQRTVGQIVRLQAAAAAENNDLTTPPPLTYSLARAKAQLRKDQGFNAELNANSYSFFANRSQRSAELRMNPVSFVNDLDTQEQPSLPQSFSLSG
jgi:hypothetical protein